MKRRKHKLMRNKYRRIFIGCCIALPILLLYLYFSIYYSNHFYNNTDINGINISKMTLSEAEAAFNSQVNSYELVLEERNGISETIHSEDINLHTVQEGCIADLLAKQNILMWPIACFQSHKLQMNTMIEYDKTLLKDYYKNLKCLKEENIVEPENATISEYGENGFEIVSEKSGTKVNDTKLYEAICKSIDVLNPSLSLEKEGCYINPEITAESIELKNAITEMNRIAGTEITYVFGDKTEVLDGSRISEWLTVDDEFKVNLDTEGVKEYVDYIGKTYNSFGRVRSFETSYGKTIKVKGGDYGWWLNRSQEVTDLTELIQKGEKLDREPVYYQTAQQYGDNDIGDTYVEVNLTAQHLFFYKDGELILESDFVSGNVSSKMGTPTGTYPIQYKENDATLQGEDYSTPVKYWMPFNKNIGLHDASWRDEFGKDIYLTNGSHGCINMPPAKAKKIYENIHKGVAVVVYKLKGTENYDLEEDKDKEEQDIPAEPSIQS